MRLPRISLLPHLLREVYVKRTLKREPESSLVMEDAEEAEAFDVAGKSGGALAAMYLFNVGHTSQAIQGCRKVIDLGCGPANQLAMLARLHPETQFIGLDLSTSMLKCAQQTIDREQLSNVTFQEMDFSALDGIPDGSVDGVISTFALHHLPTRNHLKACFRNIKRILKPDGAVCLLDLGRLKSLKTVMYFAYRDAASLPYLFTLDFERSLRAAFTLEDLQGVARDTFGDRVQVSGSYKVPLIVLAKTPAQTIPPTLQAELRRLRLQMPIKYRDDLDDLRVFFYMDGLRNDPFGPFLPGDNFLAHLRMAKILELPIQYRLITYRFSRLLALCSIFLNIGMWKVWEQALCLFSPRERTSSIHDRVQQKIGDLVRNRLGLLKGPLMKFGQMASYLSSDLPASLCKALEPLQSMSPPIPGETVRRIVERELGKPISELFLEWRDTPLSAASISQLHYARLPDGRPVVVKVHYPGIASMVKADLKNLKMFAPLLRKISNISNILELLNELESLIVGECQFKKAADFQEEFRQMFEPDADVIIPKVHRHLTTDEVLTMDYVEGLSYSEFKEQSSQEEKNKAAETIWKVAAVSLNSHGLYNADPHPGNYLFVDGKVCLLDFGFTKRFTPEFVNLWKEQSLAGCANDLERFAQANRGLGFDVDDRFLLSAYRYVLYQPWMDDRVFKFDELFVHQEFKAIIGVIQPRKGGFRWPVEFLSILRLLWGQHAILADLQAESNWHRVVFPLLKEPTPLRSLKIVDDD